MGLKFIVTANVSAGKSTLINALTGTKIANTSLEVCTGNISYIYSKQNDDNRTNISEAYKTNCVDISFNNFCEPKNQVCFIDTPGVNNALTENHRDITIKALLNERYDKLIYVFNAEKLGTDDEIKYLKWIAENINNEKIIFVVNKLDNLNPPDDDIDDSIKNVIADLINLGFENPVICPISAYFGFLIKQKNSGITLLGLEEFEYRCLSEKFNRNEYDLSKYYSSTKCIDNEYISLAQKCGLYGLEKILFGGEKKFMKKVFIKYNPYKLETIITVDGKNLKDNSKIREAVSDSRLQEWVEDLPEMLVEEYNDKVFEVSFNGTRADYDDLAESFTEAYGRKIIKGARFDYIEAKNSTEDKLPLIDEVFTEIQKGPFKEFRDDDVVSAFNNAKSNEFPVCIVATMSSGKSTLINSMLGEKILPAKSEACTAVITQIKDNDNAEWQAEVYDKQGKNSESYKKVNLKTMERLNSDENVSEISLSGDIPFVTSADTALVLIDTPGPNNARNQEHKAVQKQFLKKSSKSLVLYIMEPSTYQTDSSDELLESIAESMSVNGKQSKDRFIFVINKLDGWNEGKIDEFLGRVREYLKEKGISKPNLYPAAALPALNIRLMNSGSETDKQTASNTKNMVESLNRFPEHHFEKYAQLPRIQKKMIADEVESLNAVVDKKIGDIKKVMLNAGLSESAAENAAFASIYDTEEARNIALIHTGIPSIEAAIRQYVNKYAKAVKIKNVADTVIHKIDEIGMFEKLKQDIAMHQEQHDDVLRQIYAINKKINDFKSAANYEKTVDSLIKLVNNEAHKTIEKNVTKFQSKIRNEVVISNEQKLSIDEAQKMSHKLENLMNQIEPEYQRVLEEVFDKTLVETCKALIEEYIEKIRSLTENVDSSMLSGIEIEPLKFISGSIPSAESINLGNYMKTETVSDGTEWVQNTDKKWYKPWTWGQEKGYWREKFKNVQYIKSDELQQIFIAPADMYLHQNAMNSEKQISVQSEKIRSKFNDDFEKLDNVIKNKLEELGRYASDKEFAEKQINETQNKLDWLENMKRKINSIIEI